MLHPRSPFSLHWTARIFEEHDPSVRYFSDGIFLVAALLPSGPALLTITQEKQDSSSPLIINVHSDDTHPPNLQEVSDFIVHYFTLDEDLSGFHQAIIDDPIMAALTRRFYGLHSPTTPTVFEALVDSVIEQQISLSVARGLEYRFIRRYGRSFSIKGKEYYCYPVPEDLASVPAEDYRSCGLTVRKGEYIRDISKKITGGHLNLETLADYSNPEDIIRSLCSIRGIGRWTAELTMLRGMHRMDAFPADDIALRRMISRWYYQGEKITAGMALKIAEQWGEWKGLASFYLEVAEHCLITPETIIHADIP